MAQTQSPILVDNRTARHVLLNLQGLARPPQRRLDKDGLLGLIDRLGFVQIDSIQWVERAHHMILHARCQSYRPKQLARLIEKDRALFEHWTHDASIIPVAFFPYWKRRFARRADDLRDRMSRWQGEGYIDHIDLLLERIRCEGAVRSRDLERPERTGKQEMWKWHDGKTALEYLWHTGALCIAARDNFQKVYDLAERVIPPNVHVADMPDHDAYVDWACRSALDRLGFGSAGDIARFWDLVTIDEAKEWLDRQSEATVARVAVAPAGKGKPRELFARPDIEDVIAQLDAPPPRLRALSPFDPLIRDRNRLTWLFGFDYRIEIYVPEPKRKYGYYVFPLLDGERLIGRIDMRADRNEGRLDVRRMWLEPGVRWSPARQARLEKELQRQAKLCGVTDVVWSGDFEAMGKSDQPASGLAGT